MEDLILPLDIIINHIAPVSAGTLWICLSLSRVIYNILKPNLNDLHKRFLRHINTRRDNFTINCYMNPNGTHEGEFTVTYDNPYTNNKVIVNEANYLNGIPHGVFISRDDQGKVVKRHEYKYGKLHGVCIDRKTETNGMPVIVEATYINGKLHGAYKETRYTGSIQRKSNYVNGKIHGEDTKYYSDGSPSEIVNYRYGVKEGYSFKFDKSCGVLWIEAGYYYKGKDYKQLHGAIGNILYDLYSKGIL
jgi:hypothetical protein